MEWDEVYKRNYQSKCFGNIHWIRKANDLIDSARLLEPKVTKVWESWNKHSKNKSVEMLSDKHLGTYFMLLAYAVENLLKASIIRANRNQFEREFRKKNTFPKVLRSHNLVDLAKSAGLDFDLDGEDLLRRLTRSATWYGRYPVPLHYKQSASAEKFSDGEDYAVSWFGGNDVERLNALLDNAY